MKRRPAIGAGIVFAALLTTGCGNGGASSSTPGVIGVSPAPTPSPSPSPTPTPSSPLYPSAPFGLVAGEEFTLVGWVRDADGSRPVAADAYGFGWGRDPDTYRLRTPDFSDGLLRYTFPGENAYAFSVFLPDGSDTGATASVTVDRVYARTFRYLGLLSWWNEDTGGEVIFGEATPAHGLPTTGTATYRMDAAGTSWTIEIDFGSRTVTGKAKIVWSDAWGPYDPVFYDLEAGMFDPNTGEISASFAIPDSTLEGRLTGRLMGPSANEVALAIRGGVLNPYTNEFEVVRYSAPGELF